MTTKRKIESSTLQAFATVPHIAVVHEAIRDYIEREETRGNFRQEALESWTTYKETPHHLSGEEVRDWLKTWEMIPRQRFLSATSNRHRRDPEDSNAKNNTHGKIKEPIYRTLLKGENKLQPNAGLLVTTPQSTDDIKNCQIHPSLAEI